MLRTLFYSYKGGTGRTTATANVASLLARSGRRVICIDMDIEGPGLSVLFEVESKSEKYIQDYLNSSQDYSLCDSLIDVGRGKPDLEIDPGKLLLLPASIGYEKPVNYMGDRPRELTRQLLEKIEDVYQPDFIIMDSPSGYGDMSALAMVFAEHMLLMFKWSRQHLIGTVRITEFIKYLRLQFTLVASSVPQSFSPQMDKYKALIENRIGQPVEVLVPENEELKWREHIINHHLPESELLKGYDAIAKTLIDRNNSKE